MYLSYLFTRLTDRLLPSSKRLQDRYQAFRALLDHDGRAHELMAELEQYYYDRRPVDVCRVERLYQRLAEQVRGMITNLAVIDPLTAKELKPYFQVLDKFTRFIFDSDRPALTGPPVQALAEVDPEAESLVGGKAANLARVGRRVGLKIPDGFVVTAAAFEQVIEANDLRPLISRRLAELDPSDQAGLARTSAELTEAILSAALPDQVGLALDQAGRELARRSNKEAALAVRSSAVGEDGPASFAGQYATELNVRPEELKSAYLKVAAAKYSPRAIHYRINRGLSDRETPMAVLVLEMIPARASGVIYTSDPEQTGAPDLVINSVFGLGELLVSGASGAEEIRLSRTYPPRLTDRRTGSQTEMLAPGQTGGLDRVALDLVSPGRAPGKVLSDREAEELAQWALELERHWGQPLDIEFCRDQADELIILQARPLAVETGGERPDCDFPEAEALALGGRSASSGIGAGPVWRPGDSNMDSETDSGVDSGAGPPEGAVLVARTASPDYAVHLPRLAGAVFELGSPAGHLASVAREYGVPMIVGLAAGLDRLDSGRQVTVFANKGLVFDGKREEMLASPCARPDLTRDSAFDRKLKYIVNFISPLGLTDPKDAAFRPAEARSLHDVIRFTHERAVESMFFIGDKRMSKNRTAKKLAAGIPMVIYAVNLGGGLIDQAVEREEIGPADLNCRPLSALLAGLTDPGIVWGEFSHFNWAEYDRIVMSGGIISAEAAVFSSYALIAPDYLNLNLKFGYHFTVLDAVCGPEADQNHILLRFAGGGDSLDKRLLRAEFLKLVLTELGFGVETRSDLLDARLPGLPAKETDDALKQVGLLLGATRLMDMHIKAEDDLEEMRAQFFAGRYDFSSVGFD